MLKKLIALLLSVVMLFSFAACYNEESVDVFEKFKKTAEYECPNFVNMTIDNVKAHEYFTNAILNFKFEFQENAEYAENRIFDQSISKGEKFKKGATITIYVSSGANEIEIPNIFDVNEVAAKEQLLAKGFKFQIKKIADHDIAEGNVIKTDPAIGTKISKSTTITVYVSTGKSQNYVSVPALVGRTQKKAKEMICDAGLIYRVEEKNVSKGEYLYDKGTVMAQEPVSGKVLEGTEITIYVSTGYYEYNVVVEIRDAVKEHELGQKGYIYLYRFDESTGGERKISESEELDFATIDSYEFVGIITVNTKESCKAKVVFSNDETKTEYCITETYTHLDTGNVFTTIHGTLRK